MSDSPKLGYVILYVQDVLETIAFYETAFDLPRGFVHESKQYAQMKTGTTALAFADETTCPVAGAFRQARGDEESPAFEVALVVSDVEQAYKRAIAAGAPAVASPSLKPWGQTVAYVKDLNGVLVELCTSMGD